MHQQEQASNPAEMYQQYFVPAIFDPWAPVLLQYAAPVPGEAVLDVAAGTGALTRAVAPLLGPTGRVVAVDISPPMLAVARALPAPEGAPVAWVEASADALPGGGYDLVLCQQGLQFFPDRDGATRQMRRVLGNGGRVALAVWQQLDRQPVYQALCEADARYLGVPIDDVATPFSLGDADELHRLLDSAGFRDVTIGAETRAVTFPAPSRFVELTALAAAAVMPELAELDDVARGKMVQAIERETAPVLRRYTVGDAVRFPMHAHIAVAFA
jgi:SAM-dependent methyltransferase